MSMEETRYKNTRELVSMDTTEKEKTAVAVAYEPGERAQSVLLRKQKRRRFHFIGTINLPKPCRSWRLAR